jgi:hypothetical protein
VSVDDADHRGRQPARSEVIDEALPRLERFPAAALQGDELFLAIGPDGHHRQHGKADDTPSAPYPQRDCIEVQPEDIQLGQRAGAPGLRLDLECAHDPGDGTLRERRRLEQRRQRPP